MNHNRSIVARLMPCLLIAAIAACEKEQPPAANDPTLAAQEAAERAAAPTGTEVVPEPSGPAATRDTDVPGATGIDPGDDLPKLREPTAINSFRIAVPRTWESREPSSQMRAAEFATPGGAEIVFFGDLQLRDMPREQMVESNIARWAGQVRGPGGDPAEGVRASRVVGPFTITQYTATGTYMSGMPGQTATRLDDHTLVGAIIEGPGGVSFVRMTGQATEVAAALPDWTAMLNSVQEK